MDFENEVAKRAATFNNITMDGDGISELYWLKADDGAFVGPLMDWVKSHKKTVQENCKNFGSVVMAGGNCGMYPLAYSKMFEFVYTFEPDVKNFHCLVLNNQLPNVFKFNCALGAAPGLCSLSRPHPNNFGMHSINPHSKVEHIPMVTLDSFEFENLGLIHLDVEGYEQNVLEGATKTIEKHRPMLLLERGNTYQPFLQSMNYKHVGDSVADAIFLPN